jgi:hypothetical protein
MHNTPREPLAEFCRPPRVLASTSHCELRSLFPPFDPIERSERSGIAAVLAPLHALALKNNGGRGTKKDPLPGSKAS